MGSPLRLSVCLPPGSRRAGAAAAETAWDLVQKEFKAAEAALSRFQATSDLTTLNAVAGTGRAAVVSRRLERALIAADRAWRATDGVFDPRVIDALERIGEHGAALPASSTGTARSAGTRVVEREARHRVRIARPLDLGGIGKGLALRWASDAITRIGLADWLLDAGGDLVARGSGPDGTWSVGIEDPAGGSDILAAISIGDGAVATSSIRRRRWIHDGRSVHHLIDPATGVPADAGLQAVTVAAADPAWAEVWSKTLFIGGRARIAATARRRGLAAWWVTDDDVLEMTAAARVRTTWTAAEDGP